MISKEDVLAAAVEKSKEHGIELELILAFIEVESSFYPFAFRFEPKWRVARTDDQIRQVALHNNLSESTERIELMSSFGVMQVMGEVARELGYTGRLTDLFDPVYGIQYGCLKLKKCLEKYPNNQDDAIAAYNAGVPTMTGGGYKNQAYVDAIKKALEKQT
jgi:soluble lytic murein transglycosylase-like protein